LWGSATETDDPAENNADAVPGGQHAPFGWIRLTGPGGGVPRTTAAPETTAGPGTTAAPLTTAGPPDEELEPVDVFLALLAGAFGDGDSQLLYDRMNAAVIDRYGVDQCDAYAQSLHDPSRHFTVRAVSSPRDYAWSSDSLTTTVPDTLTVEVDAVIQGTTSQQTVHIARVGPKLTWFADCGSPIAK
jgi:hypothetical protein